MFSMFYNCCITPSRISNRHNDFFSDYYNWDGTKFPAGKKD